MKKATLVAVIAALAVVSTCESQAAGAHGPRKSFYSGHAHGDDPSRIDLTVTRRANGARVLRLDRVDDGCGGNILAGKTERLDGAGFHFDHTGQSMTTGFSARLDGRFQGPGKAIVSLTSSIDAPTGPNDVDARCSVTTKFYVRRLSTRG